MAGAIGKGGAVEKLPLIPANGEEAAALVAVVRRLSVARSVPEIVETVTHPARSLLHAGGVTFVLREGELCYYAEEDAISPLWKGRRFPMDACISGWCMRERKSVAIRDIYDDPRIPHAAYRPTFVRSLAMVPLPQENPVAAMGAYWPEVRNVSRRELELLQTVANAAALAIANVELRRAKHATEGTDARQSGSPHRVEDNLTDTRSLVDQIDGQIPAEYRAALLGRLDALEHSHAAPSRPSTVAGQRRDPVRGHRSPSGEDEVRPSADAGSSVPAAGSYAAAHCGLFDEFPLRALFDAVEDGLVVFDRDGFVRALNPAARRIFGYATEEVVGRRVSMLLVEPDRPPHDGSIGEDPGGAPARTAWNDRYRRLGRRKDGSTFWLALSVVEMAVGAARYRVAMVRDVGARKWYEDALRASEARFRLVTDSLHVLIAHVGPDERYRLCNKAYEEWFDLQREHIVGRHVREVLGGPAAETLRIHAAAALAGQASGFEGEIAFKRGPRRHVRAVFVPHVEDDGHVDGYHVITRDLTERRGLDRELRQARKMEALGGLASEVAHDFNNLLAVVAGNLEVVRQLVDGDEAIARRIDRVLSAVFQGRSLTDRLLCSGHKDRRALSAVDLAVLVAETTELARSGLCERIEAEISEDLWRCRADPVRLETALLNLLINARDAMPNGGRALVRASNVTFGPEDRRDGPDLKPGDYVVLSVTDEGTGIPPEILDRVTKPYFTTKAPGEGSGLGLSTVKDFAIQCGGDLVIGSTGAAGTTVSLYLPRWRTDGRPAAGPSPGGPGQRRPSIAAGHRGVVC